MGDHARRFVARKLWLLVAVLTLPLAMLAGVLGLDAAASAIVVVGWFVLTPVFLLFGRDIAAFAFSDAEETTESEAGRSDPLAELKGRYARGEIDEAEFERRLDRLVALDEFDDELSPSEDDPLDDLVVDRDTEGSDERLRETN